MGQGSKETSHLDRSGATLWLQTAGTLSEFGTLSIAPGIYRHIERTQAGIAAKERKDRKKE